MKTPLKNWAWPCGFAAVGVLVVYTCLSAWGQSAPGLSIAVTNNNSVFLVVTNGLTTGKYSIYWSETLDDDEDWELFTNGGTGITNFTISMEDTTSGFFAAENTSTVPFVLNLTVLAPVSGQNVQ
jgi:hypothetical protein